MRTTVQKKFRFYAAHRNELIPGKCQNLHGHTYHLRVGWVLEPDPHTGVSVLFEDLENMVLPLVNQLDHSTLIHNQDTQVMEFLMNMGMKMFPMSTPTSVENLCSLVFNWITHQEGPDPQWVEIQETETSVVRVERELKLISFPPQEDVVVDQITRQILNSLGSVGNTPRILHRNSPPQSEMFLSNGILNPDVEPEQTQVEPEQMTIKVHTDEEGLTSLVQIHLPEDLKTAITQSIEQGRTTQIQFPDLFSLEHYPDPGEGFGFFGLDSIQVPSKPRRSLRDWFRSLIPNPVWK